LLSFSVFLFALFFPLRTTAFYFFKLVEILFTRRIIPPVEGRFLGAAIGVSSIFSDFCEIVSHNFFFFSHPRAFSWALVFFFFPSQPLVRMPLDTTFYPRDFSGDLHTAVPTGCRTLVQDHFPPPLLLRASLFFHDVSNASF